MGVGARILAPLRLVVVDIMRSTGRYNLALGAVGTMVGVGASLSGLVAGVIVDHFGYSEAFLGLAVAAAIALIAFALAMPETMEAKPVNA